MDYAETLTKLNQDWLIRRASLDKSELAYLSNKDTFQGRRVGFLTRAYYQRSKLIRSSEIYYAFVFKSWSNDVSERGTYYPTWLLFSPSKEINENPAILKDICAKVQSIRDLKPASKEEKELKKNIEEPLSDVSYFPIPEALSDGRFAYLSIVYLPLHHVPFFRLGVNLILASPSVSHEVLYLPEKYWPEDYRKAYKEGKLVL